jgi:type IV pilus assembly protein PilM
MAEQQTGVWGIDIGQSALKALRLELVDGEVVATAFDYVEHPKILSQPDADPDQLTREALEKFLSRNTLHGDTVAISVPGQSGLARFVKLPPVEEKKIPDIVRFEAKQQIPFPLDEVVWDYQKIGSGAVSDGFAMETEIGLFAIKRDMVNRALQQFSEVDIEVQIVQMAPLALSNFMSYDLLKKGGPGDDQPKTKGAERQCVVALDIGTDNSNLVITDGERVIWQRPIPFGGNHFTRALSKDFKLTFAKAEHLKRNATKSPDLKKILTSLKPVLNDFVGEVQRSLGYFTNTHRNATIMYMMGLGNAFRLPGLQRFLSEKLQLEVKKLQKMDRLGGESVVGAPAFSQNVLSFSTAYGLALQGLDLARLKTNLLPQDIRYERMVRAKKPWAVAAAASLLLAILVASFSYGLQFRAVDTDPKAPVGAAIAETKSVIDATKRDEADFNAAKTKVEDRERAVKNIIAGQEERLNWLLLNEYINASLPAPGERLDGKLKSTQGASYVVVDRSGKEHTFQQDDTLIVSNSKPVTLAEVKPDSPITVIYNTTLNPEAKPYWTPQARTAFLNLIERQVSGRTDTKGMDETLKHLIQINIDSVVPLYTQDIKSYYDQVRPELERRFEADVRKMFTEEEYNTPPEAGKKGWIVEVRGHTFHDNVLPFLLNTFHKKLLANAAKAKPAEGTATSTADTGVSSPAATETAASSPGSEKAPTAPTPEQEHKRLWERVIAGQVKYVVLYAFQQSQVQDASAARAEPMPSVVTRFASGGTAGAAAPGGDTGVKMGGKGGAMMSPGAFGGGASAWAPLVGIDAGGVAAGAGKSSGGLPTLPSERPPTGPGSDRPTAAGSKPTIQRTDFIILFAWSEPAADIGAPAAPTP